MLHSPKHDVSFAIFTGEIVNIFPIEHPMHGLDIPCHRPAPLVRDGGVGKKFQAGSVNAILVGGTKKTVGSYVATPIMRTLRPDPKSVPYIIPICSPHAQVWFASPVQPCTGGHLR